MTYTFTKTANRITINSFIDKYPFGDYIVQADNSNGICIIKKSDGGLNLQVKPAEDTIVINGDTFTGTAAELEATLNDEIFVDSLGYLVYTALLTQSGTSAPVATVLQNTLGGTVVWTRINTGVYIGTLAGAFPEDKTICPPFGNNNNFCFLPLSNNTKGYYNAGQASINTVFVTTYSDLDYSAVDLSTISPGSPILIEIRVYP